MAKKQGRALYEKIRDDLIERIENGSFEDMEKIPSESQLSEQYGVSRITAIKALNELMLEGYISRIQGKGSFVIPAEDRQSAMSRTSTPYKEAEGEKPLKIGVIIPAIGDIHGLNLVKSIAGALPFPQYACSFVMSFTQEQEKYAIDDFLRHGYDALAIFPQQSQFYSEAILELNFNDFPLVIIDRVLAGINMNYAVFDNEASCRLIISYLRDMNHRKIAFLSTSSKDELITERRKKLLKKLTDKYGDMSFWSAFSITEEPTFTEDFLSRIRAGEITAVVCGNSGSAELVARICARGGLRVPEDVSLVCFDMPTDVEMPFTHIEQGSRELAEKGCAILKVILSGKVSRKERRNVVQEPRLIQGRSVRKLEAGSEI